MKQLKDLKEEILNNQFQNFYVFYGEDFGLRKHYINAIAKNYDRLVAIDDYLLVSENVGSALIQTSTLFLIYGCEDFCKITVEQLNGFKKKIGNNCVIFDYETIDDKSNLFKEFNNSITYFPIVKDSIGEEFVLSELNVIQKDCKVIAYNCFNNYNSILMECDKIKSYANEKNISQQQAYEILTACGQLNYRYEEYNNDIIVNDLLVYNNQMFSYWDKFITKNYINEFWYNLGRTVSDFLIAYFLVKYGKWDGGSIAYNNGLPWYRIKVLRELPIRFDADTLLYYATELADIDYKIKTGKMQPSDIYNYFVYVIM